MQPWLRAREESRRLWEEEILSVVGAGLSHKASGLSVVVQVLIPVPLLLNLGAMGEGNVIPCASVSAATAGGDG